MTGNCRKKDQINEKEPQFLKNPTSDNLSLEFQVQSFLQFLPYSSLIGGHVQPYCIRIHSLFANSLKISGPSPNQAQEPIQKSSVTIYEWNFSLSLLPSPSLLSCYITEYRLANQEPESCCTLRTFPICITYVSFLKTMLPEVPGFQKIL